MNLASHSFLTLPCCSFYGKNAWDSSPPDSKQRFTKSSRVWSAQLGLHKSPTMKRHMPKLYYRLLASLLAKHKRNRAAQGHMHQHGPPMWQLQTGSSTPVYQQPQQPQPPQLHNGGLNSFGTGDSSTDGPDMGQSVALNSGVTALNKMTNAAVSANGNGTGNYILIQLADITFSIQGQQANLMDFTFDLTTTPRNDMLSAMQAVQNPMWWHTVMMPGSVEHVLVASLLWDLFSSYLV